jgi:phosphatidylserine/phosphatidylglycerophosphate/cardiolipin synthase-like enzyme
VTEVETLHSIHRPRRAWIHVENQYFTSGAWRTRWHAARGAGRPEIVLVVPRICSAGSRSGRWVRAARPPPSAPARPTVTTASASTTTRLPGTGDACPDLNVHAKVMIVDDALARVGSSNLNRQPLDGPRHRVRPGGRPRGDDPRPGDAAR